MKNRIFFLVVVLLLITIPLSFLGCNKKSQTALQSKSANEISGKINEAVPLSVYQEYRDLEVVPSGEDQCFLSPCDCVCYVIPNVPNTAKKVGCAINCTKTYGIKGCKFTNYQCFSAK